MNVVLQYHLQVLLEKNILLMEMSIVLHGSKKKQRQQRIKKFGLQN